MFFVVAVLLSVASSTTVQPRAAQSCLFFEPTVESIVGTLVRKTYPGPPNYESVKVGDAAETGWYVTLARPICFSHTPGDESHGDDVAEVKLVQLVLTYGEYKSHARLVGKTVKATGTFFTAQTGHHHTPVLLQIVSLEPARATGANSAARPAQSTVKLDNAEAQPVIVIRSYSDELAGVRAASPDVHLSIGRDPSMSDEPVLLVEYPEPGNDPAGRDVRCAAENQDWSGGRAISFQARPAHDLKLSVSFIDRNGVAYTAWRELKGGVPQLVRIPFDEIRPNPFFQPPDAKRGAPLDVSDVKGIAFAPQDRTPGRLAIGRFVVSQ